MLTHLRNTTLILVLLFQVMCEWTTVKAQLDEPVNAEVIAKAEEESNIAFGKRMQQLETMAKRIKIDGQARDWAQLPRFKDPQGDAKAPSLDVIEMSLVANEKYVDVLVVTRGQPSKRNFGINITLDIVGNHNPDLMVSIKNNQLIARYYDDLGKSQYSLNTKNIHPLKTSKMLFGRVVEFRLDLKEVASRIKSNKEDIHSAASKPIYRAQVKCWDGNSYVEIGPKVAVYRFSKRSYDYYGKLPKPASTRYAINMPLKGRWFLGQGPHTDITHIDRWAYDFWILGPDGTSTKSKPIKSLTQFYCYGKELYAPVKGRIVSVIDGHPDQTPRVYNPKAKSNSVMIRSKQGLDILMSHMLNGSVQPKIKSQIKLGAYLGKIGNSGRSMGPHLDLMGFAKGADGKRTTQPLALKNVRVSINNMDDDPWARDEKFWPMREGFFVTPLDELMLKQNE